MGDLSCDMNGSLAWLFKHFARVLLDCRQFQPQSPSHGAPQRAYAVLDIPGQTSCTLHVHAARMCQGKFRHVRVQQFSPQWPPDEEVMNQDHAPDPSEFRQLVVPDLFSSCVAFRSRENACVYSKQELLFAPGLLT